MTRLIRPTSLTATLAVALSLLAAAAPAPAATVPAAAEPDPCTTAMEWAEPIIAATELAPPEPWTVTFECGVDRLYGHASRATHSVTIWPEATTDPDMIEWTYLHETGHAYDLERLTADDRAIWRGARGISRDPDWWTYSRHDDPSAEQWAATPAEDFAESFATCWLGEPPAGWPWLPTHAGPPGEAECQVMATLVGELKHS